MDYKSLSKQQTWYHIIDSLLHVNVSIDDFPDFSPVVPANGSFYVAGPRVVT